jgi:hypothetical protein
MNIIINCVLAVAVFGPVFMAELVCRSTDLFVRYPLTVYLTLKVRPPSPEAGDEEAPAQNSGGIQ